VPAGSPVPPALAELATRLRELRERHGGDVKLTQAALATALADGERLSSATVSSWESGVSPKLAPAERLRAYARFFSTPRSVEGAEPRLLPLGELSEEEEAARAALEAELLALRDRAAGITVGVETAAPRRSWYFSQGPVNIVCAQLPANEAGPLSDSALPNYTELQSFADLDALIELHGHMRAENPHLDDIFFKSSAGVEPDDLSGHLVLLGGIAYNEITEILSEMTVLPVRQVADPAVTSGEIFIAEVEGQQQRFLPKWRDEEQTKLREDVALLARVPNPVNSNRTLTFCNGIHSRGVLGAVRTLTDARLRESNESYLAGVFGDSRTYAILMRVTVIEGETLTPDFNTAGTVLYQWSEETAR
jgi:transcriptional regulator with XRE-family HTH domain